MMGEQEKNKTEDNMFAPANSQHWGGSNMLQLSDTHRHTAQLMKTTLFN